MKLDSLDGLTVFAAVARRRSFSAAAADLRVTRSAVSQSIKALEQRLGVALLARTTRDVGLTEAGQLLLDQIGPALAQIQMAAENVADYGGKPSGLLRLNVPRVAIATVIAPFLPLFVSAYPDVTIEVFTDDRLANIVDEGFDAGVRLGELVEKDMVSVRLTEADRLVVAGAPAYFERHGHPASPADLSQHACINFRQSSKGGLYRWEFERAGEELDVAVNGSVIVNDSDLKVRAAIDGLGLAYELESVIRPFVDARALELTLVDFAPATPGFFLYFPARSQVMPKLRAFIDLYRSQRRQPAR